MHTSELSNVSLGEPDTVDADVDISNELAELQRNDEMLVDCKDRADKETAMDVLKNYVFALQKGQKSNRFILVICDYATRYPEAYPLREFTAKQVANVLLHFFSHVGIPKEVLTDQGTNFMSRILNQVYQLLGIKRVRTTPYHPQTDGLVEHLIRL